MWSSKMAARWSRKDGDLNAGNNHSLTGNTLSELVLCGVEDVAVDTRSCVDHSILAIFEDATGSSEDKNEAEEESETLLSALTEMLDRVEDDDGMTMSPFDTLPETSLLNHSEQRDKSPEFSLPDRQRPRPKPSNVTFTVNNGAEKDDQSETGKSSPPQLFKNPRVEPELEVFTTESLVNLVKIMHSYCLTLHVEEERDRAFFSQEEVWKYERPSEECDEEINVVSDDEVALKEESGEAGDPRKLLKSALVTRNSSREKKKVSFGPVQVASFTESMEQVLQETQLAGGLAAEEHGTKALESPPGSLPEPPSPASTAEALPPKTKSLSLQEYRQLRRKRQPLVEKQGNSNTKWPSVSEPPKELTPILCLQQQGHNKCAPKTTYLQSDSRRRPPPPETKPSTALCRSGPKRPRSDILSPASPLPGSTADPNASFCKGKRSPTKKAVVLSSDPPNPVLLPLPVSQTSSPSTEPAVEFVSRGFSSTSHSQSILCESSGPSPQHQLSTVEAGDGNQDLASGASCTSPGSQSKDQQPKTSLLPGGVEAPVPVKEMLVPSKSQTEASWQSSAADSGIEAPDLTSLLEQFEETQAKEKRGELPVGPLKPSSTSDSPGPQKTLRDPQLLQKSEGEDIPEPLGTEIILSTQQDLPARRKAAPSKTIQIIDPRPLPSKKTHSSVPEPPVALPSPHLCSSISSDHDYCGPVDRSAASTAQRSSSSSSSSSRASKLKEVSKSTDEVQVTTHGSDPDPAEIKQQTSTTTITDVNKPPMQNVAEDSCCSSDMIPSPSHRSVPEPGCGLEDRMVPCTLPTPPPSPPSRGRDKQRYRRRSHHSDSSSCSSTSSSSSSSASPSPKRLKRRHKRSESSSSSSSRSRSVSRSPPRRYSWQYSRAMSSRSRSRSLSKSRSSSRSRSPASQVCRQRWRNVSSSRESRRLRREQEIRIQKLKAIDERRVVYVGRICRSMTHDELRERFAQFGEVECVSLHFRERGDHYGFVTFYNMSDAFAAIDNGGKLRRPDELPFDLCFGGRRQFCSSDYADLDADRDTDPGPAKSKFEDLDFDQLLKQAQRGLKR